MGRWLLRACMGGLPVVSFLCSCHSSDFRPGSDHRRYLFSTLSNEVVSIDIDDACGGREFRFATQLLYFSFAWRACGTIIFDRYLVSVLSYFTGRDGASTSDGGVDTGFFLNSMK